MEVRYSRHFQERQTLRNFPEGLAEEVFFNADGHFYDAFTSTYVAVKRVYLANVERDIALTYRRDIGRVIFITIHPLSAGQKDRRVERRRWVPHEPESPL